MKVNEDSAKIAEEAMEDQLFLRHIRAGASSAKVSREEVFNALRDEA
ncbi:MAG: hypothetical protein ACOCVG_01850 [Verrucomicrobiota bacterium]